MGSNSKPPRSTRRFKIWLLLSVYVFATTSLVFCRRNPPARPLGSTYLELAKPEIWKVPANSLSQIIGLKPGDLIISYNDEVVKSYQDLQEIEQRITDRSSKIKLTVLRDEQELTLEIAPVPLGFIPKSKRYSASLAKALEDILHHFGLPGYYDWLAALTTESFGMTLRRDDCFSWGTGGKAAAYLHNLSKLTGLTLKLLWSSAAMNGGLSGQNEPSPISVIKQGLEQTKKNGGAALLVYGKWNGNRVQWGIPAQLVTNGDSLPRVYGWTIEPGGEQTVCSEIFSVYQVGLIAVPISEPARLVSTVLDQALEIGLATADTGWHSGLEAYDILLKKLEQFPVCPDGPATADECFYHLLYTLISSKESANQFFEDMKMALPEQASLFDKVIEQNRAIIARLEGIDARRLSLNTLENQQKIARVLVEIEEIENDLLGIYEEIIGEL
ncbi:MAG: hypothetical protein ACUVUR_02680 [bacterium]